MSGEVSGNIEDDLILRADLAEMARVPLWIEGLAFRHAIDERIQFSINVCLEEVIANVILHGYSGRVDGTITVRFDTPRAGYFLFIVDDAAPPFDPLEPPALSALRANEEMWVGGQGIRMLREFADSLEYERTPTGNRLQMSFLNKEA